MKVAEENKMTGWQCPICGKVLAPWIIECDGDHIKIEITYSGQGTTFGDVSDEQHYLKG